jgi:hypothetical protein
MDFPGCCARASQFKVNMTIKTIGASVLRPLILSCFMDDSTTSLDAWSESMDDALMRIVGSEVGHYEGLEWSQEMSTRQHTSMWAVGTLSELFISQCNHRIDAHGPSCWQIARQNGHAAHGQNRQSDCDRIRWRQPVEKTPNQPA